MSQPSQSPLDDPKVHRLVREYIAAGKTNSSIVSSLSTQGVLTTKDSIRRFRKRNGLAPPSNSPLRPGVKVEKGTAEVTTPRQVGVKLDDPDTMLEERGLDPAEWDIEGAVINEWDGPSQEGPVTYHQAKLRLKRNVDSFIFPARSDGWKAPQRSLPTEGSHLVAIIGDQQEPFADENLHYLLCGWLEQNQPDEIVSLGDTVDFPDISRHRLDPENGATVNECIQTGYDNLRGVRQAAPNARIRKLAGNHDERMRNILLDKPAVRSLYGVKQADTPDEDGPPVLSIPHLLRLDELGIEYVDPSGPYDMAQINLSDHLAVRHGWIARQGSGVSALATLDYLGYSCIVGHTHRQSLIYKTRHDIDGGTTTLTAAEAGCLCKIDQKPYKGRQWPNYTVAPDWQQGFSTAVVHADGTFRIENATYVKTKGKGVLLWRDEQYR